MPKAEMSYFDSPPNEIGVPLTAKQLVAFTCRTACAVLKSSLSEKIQPMSEADIPSRHCVVSALGAFVKLCVLLHGNESLNVQYLAGYFRRYNPWVTLTLQ